MSTLSTDSGVRGQYPSLVGGNGTGVLVFPSVGGPSFNDGGNSLANATTAVKPALTILRAPGFEGQIVTFKAAGYFTTATGVSTLSLYQGSSLNASNDILVASAATGSLGAGTYPFSFSVQAQSSSLWAQPFITTGIVSTSVASNVVTVNGVFFANGQPTLTVGQAVYLKGLTTTTALNGQTLTVASLLGTFPNYTGFTAAFTHANYSTALDTGTVYPATTMQFANATCYVNGVSIAVTLAASGVLSGVNLLGIDLPFAFAAQFATGNTANVAALQQFSAEN